MSIFRRQKEAVTAKQPVKHEVLHGLMHKLKEAAGITRIGYGIDSTNRLPHPQNMGRYAELCTDPTVSVAIDIKRDMVVPDFYFEMPEDKPIDTTKQKVEAVIQPDTGAAPKDANPQLKPTAPKPNPEHPNKKKLEEWKKTTKATKKLKQIVSTMIAKGFCPVEITNDYNLKVLPPESFFIYRDKVGEVLKYTQEDSMKVLNTWQGAAMDDIILFINDEDTDHPYGESDVESLATLLDTRHELNEDMGKIIKRFSAPFGILRSSGSATDLKTNIAAKDVDEILFLGNTEKDQVELMFEEPDPQCKFLPYIDSVDFQIGQKLNAPLILLLKNATEASATKMLDAIDRWVQSTQNEIAEILEERIYTKICGSGPIPIHKWGAPKEVLDDITLGDIASLTGKSISKRQAQDLIRQKGIELLEDEAWLSQPDVAPNPFDPNAPPQDKANPFQKQPFPPKKVVPNIPVESVERLNDLGTQLAVIEANHKKKDGISLVEAANQAERCIMGAMKRIHGSDWQRFYNEAFQTFLHEHLVPKVEAKKPTYKVTVD
jgi:hypothetical protein